MISVSHNVSVTTPQFCQYSTKGVIENMEMMDVDVAKKIPCI